MPDPSHSTRIYRWETLPFLSLKTGADKTYAVRRHSHDTLSVGFVEEGSSVIRCHPLEFNLDAGDALLIPPGAIHLCQPRDPDRFRFTMLYICPDWLKNSMGLDTAGLGPASAALSSQDRERAADFFTSLRYREDRFLDETNAIFFLDHLFNGIFREAFGSKPGDQDLPADQMDRVKRFLDDHFDRDIQLEDLSAISGTSKYTLLRQFKQQWQITPHAYVLNRRVQMAKAMLKDGHTVADTAAACGFFDQSHFVKTFKNFVGIRPAAYSG